MLTKAAWKDSTVIFKNQVFDIKRGQIVTSQRKLSSDFGWSREKTISFINLLQKNTTITQETSHGFLLITICNYEKYQGFENDDQPQTDKTSTNKPAAEAQKTRPNRINKENKKKEIIFILPNWISENDWNDFMEVRKKLKAVDTVRAKNSLVQTLADLRAKGHDPTMLLERSIKNSWKDIYEPKPERQKNGQHNDIFEQGRKLLEQNSLGQLD